MTLSYGTGSCRLLAIAIRSDRPVPNGSSPFHCEFSSSIPVGRERRTSWLARDKLMGNEEEEREQWQEVIARIGTQIDDFKTRIDSESQQLYTKLSAEIAVLQSDLRNLEARVLTVDLDVYARQIAAQIEALRAQGDAAYDLLQSWLATKIDPTEAEIRRLEAIAGSVAPDARVKIMARIEKLKAARAATPVSGCAQHGSEQLADTSS